MDKNSRGKYFIVNKIEEIQIRKRGVAMWLAGTMFRINEEKNPVTVYRITKKGLKLIKNWKLNDFGGVNIKEKKNE